MPWIRAAAATPFGRREGSSTLSLMREAADLALAASGLERAEIDGLVTGYSTAHPHLMLATVFAEHYGLSPRYAHAIQMGGGTGAGMIMLAAMLVRSGEARHVLVAAGENRLTGMSRDGAIRTLAQVGHPQAEAPQGAIIPAYYALSAARYLHETEATPADLAALAVLMRTHAARTPGAHLADPIDEADVLASKPVAAPLKLLDCCPISDGGAAVIVSAEPGGGARIRIAGAAQAHTHQHISEAPDDIALGARRSSAEALERAGMTIADMDHLAIYDSFTVTLALLLEAAGVSAPGRAGAEARDGRFAHDGPLPLNTHGGLLSYGHCGVAGAMAHLAEAHARMSGPDGPARTLHHGDGGILSSHVSLVLERAA